MASPLPIEQKFAVALLGKLGRPVTTAAVKNLVGWMRAEGGHTHNNARFNFLNTTQPAPGAGNTGSQGNIKVYRSFDQGVDATVQTLNNGLYGSILSHLNANPTAFAAAVNSTPWGTKTNFGSISASITPSGNFARAAQSGGGPPVAATDRGVDSSAAPRSLNLAAVGGPLMRLLNATRQRVLAGQMPAPNYSNVLAGLVANAIRQQPINPQAAEAGATVAATPAADNPSIGGNILPHSIYGSPIPGQSPHASSHQTSGLPGYPAFDYMAPAGTKVAAPSGGTIIRLSGKDPRLGGSPGGPLGYSIYLKGNDGKTYFLTHLDRIGVKVGQRVRQGQQIAVVANGPRSWSSPHVHQGVHG